MPVTITLATPADLKQILRLQKKCFGTEADLHNEYHLPPLLQDLQSLRQEFETTTILKAVMDNRIVGSVRGTLKEETCRVGRLIVDDDYQNQGIGQQLMMALEKMFYPCKRFELFTGYKSEKNLYLYRKLGYQEYKRQMINDNLTLVFLEKKTG